MRILKILYVLIGLGLLGVVLADVDVAEVADRVSMIGWGLAVVLGLYCITFTLDSLTWLLALTDVKPSLRWLFRMWRVRIVGEVFNSVMPAAGMGGEPVKAVLLKKHYGIGYRAGTTSIILAKTVNMMALVLFLAAGFGLMWGSSLPQNYKMVAGAGLAAFTLATVIFFSIQRLKVSSITGTWISRWPVGRRLEEVLHHIHDMDDRLVRFYTVYRPRIVLVLVLALASWMVGILEIYFVMAFLGHPVTLTEAWIIEAVTQMVRAGTFFIPASLGAQEGAFLVICSAVTGSPSLGIAAAVVRRFREILWILFGVLIGSQYSLKSIPADADDKDTD